MEGFMQKSHLNVLGELYSDKKSIAVIILKRMELFEGDTSIKRKLFANAPIVQAPWLLWSNFCENPQPPVHQPINLI